MPIVLIVLGFGLVFVGVVFAIGGFGKGKAAGSALKGVSVTGPSWLVLVALGAGVIVYGTWMFERDGLDGPAPDLTTPAFADLFIEPFDFGDDLVLDQLWLSCQEGDGFSCDELFQQSPVGSAYERFGLTCGDRFLAGPGSCVEEDMSVFAE